MYSITYSTGTSRNDEKRFVVRDVPAARLATKIAALQGSGKSIYAVERTSEFGA